VLLQDLTLSPFSIFPLCRFVLFDTGFRPARPGLRSATLSNAAANLDADARVHPKNVGGCASDRSEPHNESVASKTKVFGPNIRAGIEKPCQLAGVRINAGEIRSLFSVAQMAGKGEVGYLLSSAMLSRDNMLHMKSEVGIILLVNSAILTTVVSPLANKVFGSVIHYAFGELETHARALSRRSATKSISSI